MFAFPQYDEALGPHDPATLQDRWPHPAYVRPEPLDVSAYLTPRTRIADRERVRLVRPSATPPSYLERLLKWYLQLGIIEAKWIPQIRERLAETGQVFIPEVEGVTRLRDPVQFSIQHTLKSGKTIRVYPVTEKPWATFLHWGAKVDGPLRGKCIWMEDSFFLTHGTDGLPLDL